MDKTTNPAGRGGSTREALIRATITIVGREGFDAASTRAISEAAGVNQALIGYHFGGKPGLYLAALRCIADSVVGRMGPLVDAIEAELERGGASGKREPSAARAIELLHGLTDGIVEMLAGDESSAWARVILREQQDPSEGFDILYEGFMHRFLGVVAQLVRLARGGRSPRDADRLTALTIVGQALVFRAARTTVLREMGWKGIAQQEIRAIQAELRRNVAAMLAQKETR
jgi:AcrR family transcriptional regulator